LEGGSGGYRAVAQGFSPRAPGLRLVAASKVQDSSNIRELGAMNKQTLRRRGLWSVGGYDSECSRLERMELETKPRAFDHERRLPIARRFVEDVDRHAIRVSEELSVGQLRREDPGNSIAKVAANHEAGVARSSVAPELPEPGWMRGEFDGRAGSVGNENFERVEALRVDSLGELLSGLLKFGQKGLHFKGAPSGFQGLAGSCLDELIDRAEDTGAKIVSELLKRDHLFCHVENSERFAH